MPSKIQVDQIAGATGSTVTLPSGQTLDLSSGTVNLPSASLSALNASNLTSGTVPSARLSLTSSDLPTVPTTKGGTGLTTIGTANQVLRVNSGATALEFGTVSSDYVLLATTTASNSASVSFDGYFSATYTNYIVMLSDYYHSSGGSNMLMRFRRSNADVTAGQYFVRSLAHQNAGYDGGQTNNETSFNLFVGGSCSSNSTQINTRTLTIYNPLDTSAYKAADWKGWSLRNDGYLFVISASGQLQDSTSALSGVSFFASSGNIYGKFKLYGIK